MVYLSGLANELFLDALGPNTHRAYTSAFNSYLQFCHQSGIQEFPITEQQLSLYVTSLSTRLACKTIKSYLSGIQYFSLYAGQPIQISDMDRLYYIMRGIKRRQGNRFSRGLRQPITVLHMQQILQHLRRSSFLPRDRQLWWSAITLAFFGLLRCSEYTTPTTRSFLVHSCLMFSDISFCPKNHYVIIHLKSSKTDPFRKGVNLFIGATNNFLCPVIALRTFVNSRGSTQGPLYTFSDGTFLTRGRITDLLKRCFSNTCGLSTHSFRIGGATALAAAGVSDSTIQIMGRWSSDCFKRYLRIPPNTTVSLAKQMSKPPIPGFCWDPSLVLSTKL